MKDIKTPWILIGYKAFGMEGVKGLKIEVFARKVGKSKSSFYYHFSDLEIFTSELLAYHLNRMEIFSNACTTCKNSNPELVNVFLDFKEELLFNRQLRINHSNIEFNNCYIKGSKLLSAAVLPLWEDALGLQSQANTAKLLLKLMKENFYLRITAETLTSDWLEEYMNEMQHLVKDFKKSFFQETNVRKRL